MYNDDIPTDDDEDDRFNRDDPYGDDYNDYPEDYYEEDDRFNLLNRYALAPLWRRGAALGIDAIVAGVPSSIGSPGLQLIGFALLWFVLRVVVVTKNRGQSLGRWAFDMRIVESTDGRSPGLLPLCQREAILGLAVLFCLEAIAHLNPQSAWLILGLVPLGLDVTLAYSDAIGKQTYHDRVANTYIIKSRRGYSLDLRLKRLFSATRPTIR